MNRIVNHAVFALVVAVLALAAYAMGALVVGKPGTYEMESYQERAGMAITAGLLGIAFVYIAGHEVERAVRASVGKCASAGAWYVRELWRDIEGRA